MRECDCIYPVLNRLNCTLAKLHPVRYIFLNLNRVCLNHLSPVALYMSSLECNMFEPSLLLWQRWRPVREWGWAGWGTQRSRAAARHGQSRKYRTGQECHQVGVHSIGCSNRVYCALDFNCVLMISYVQDQSYGTG